MKIVKIIQWDMGHRVLNHRSVCKGLHGHRYKAEICVSGNVVSEHGVSGYEPIGSSTPLLEQI